MAGKPDRPTSGDPSAAASGGGGGDARFLHDIEALSKALSLNPPSKSRLNTARRSLPPPPSSVRSTSEASTTNPKPSIWRSIKSLSHIGQRRFDCLFSLHVKSIDSLPTSLEGSFLSVHFHPSSSSSSPALATRPVKSSRGSAQFDETLNYRSSIYAKSSGSKTHAAKYESRQFSIHVTCGGADLGRHMVDLTRLLPLTVADLEAERDLQEEEGEEKGKWSTSFRLTGRARGAKLNVSFGYCLVCEKQVTKAPPLMKLEQRDGLGLSREKRLGEILSEKLSKVERDRAVPNFVRDRARSRSIEDVRVLHEVKKTELPVLNFKAEIEKVKEREKGGFEGVICKLQVEEETSPESKHCTEFTVIEQGVQVQTKDQKEIIDKTEGLDEKIDEDRTKDQEEINNKAEGLVEKTDEDQTKDQEEIINNTEGFVEKIDEVKTKDQEEIINKTEGSIDKSDEVEHENKDQEELITKTEGLVAKNDEAETKDQEEISTKTEELIENIEISNEVSLTAQESEENELKELESIFENLSFLESEEEFQSPNLDTKTLHKTLTHDDATNPSLNSETLIRSKSLDAQTESVASEFLTMLGLDFSPFGLSSDSDPESPREKLLRQFEQESGTLFGLDYEEDREDGIEIPGFPDPGFEIHPNPGIEIPVSKAKLMEDLETEALMREFGIDENSFLSSNEETGFQTPLESSVDTQLDPPVEFPPLGNNLGPFIQTKGGGFLRSMNPSNFKNAKNGGNLVMQSSSPVVLPAEMGEGIMDILQTLASVGIEKLSVQASKLMPLEDFTGRNIEEIAWEADPGFDSVYERQGFLESTTSTNNPKPAASSSRKTKPRTPNSSSSDYVSLEDLAPSAMEKIEALSIEGLRIQSGMSDSAPPSDISPQSLNSLSALQGKGKEVSHNNSTLRGLQGTGCLQLLDIKGDDDDDDDVSAGGGGDEADGLMGLSLSLNEWMRLDSGLIEEEDGSGEVSERTARVLAAHKANSMDLVRDGPKKKGGRKWGLLGNNFTVAIMVQLRDPLRNYETVGTPMLALIQVERVFVPPKPKIYGNVIFKVSNDELNEDDGNENKKENEIVKSEAIEEEVKVSQYKITEVHVAGFKNQETDSGDNKTKWGNNQELKSGSRWLLAAGMGKGNKNPLLKSKLSGNLKSGKGDSTLWSVSSKVSGSGKFGRNANILLGKR